MPQTAVAVGPQFETRTPDVLLSAGLLSVKMPVLNTGDSTATRLTLTNVTLGAATKQEPALPIVLGDVAAGNRTMISAVFLAGAIAPGTRLMLSSAGTYRTGGQILAFTLNRVITVPAAVPPPSPFFVARLQTEVSVIDQTWSYTIVNDEPAGSALFVNAFSLDTVGPFTVLLTPDGWAVDTDNLSYVLWYSLDPSLPYPTHVAPGTTLGGFQIQSPGVTSSEGRPYSITSWNHSTDLAGLVNFGTTLVPERS